MQNEQNISTGNITPEIDPLYSQKLDLLKAEIELYHPGLLKSLDVGMKMILLADHKLGESLNSDELRLIGAIAVLCRHKGAVLIFCCEDNVGAILSKSYPQHETPKA